MTIEMGPGRKPGKSRAFIAQLLPELCLSVFQVMQEETTVTKIIKGSKQHSQRFISSTTTCQNGPEPDSLGWSCNKTTLILLSVPTHAFNF